MKGRVLIIAGSDCSGGAGVQADIKTVTALGGYAASAITAVTVQDTTGVQDIHAIPPDIIAGQIKAVMRDIGADVIKIGMIGTPAVAAAIFESLSPWPDVPLVLDPVMVATSGDRLASADMSQTLRAMLPRVDVVTPNLMEAEELTELMISGPEGQLAAGRALLTLGAKAAIIKGGHGKSGQGDKILDILVTREDIKRFRSKRIRTRHTHGTGCTLASAIATGLAQEMSLLEATRRAIVYVQKAILEAPGFGKGNGPLNHCVSVD